jgi:hypothetical protein
MTPKWTQKDALALCKRIEQVCPQAGCHVALTGGCLYREGQRGDLDLIFYRIRQLKLQTQKLMEILQSIGFNYISGGGWRYVGYYDGKKVDLLFPESPETGDYPPDVEKIT